MHTSPSAPRSASSRTLPRATLLALALFTAGLPHAFAQQASPQTIAELHRELDALKSEQAERDLRIQRLENILLGLSGSSPAPATAGTTPPATPATGPAAATTVPASPSPALAATPVESRLKVSGDLRIRGQADSSDDDGPNRTSSQLRGRLGATYKFNDRITLGARLVTGDSDDPNSSDVQLSNWLDDLEVSLDQAYMQFDVNNLKIYAGKIPQPFIRTDLVWDGDVNPQGVGSTYRKAFGNGGAFRANSLFFIVDERAAGSDSTMLGAQFGYESPAYGSWKYDVAAAYYHYNLGSIAGADAGDFRSNLRNPDGSFLSDFRLANAIVGVSHAGFGEQWPVRIVGDYVKNLGAATDADTGFSIDAMLGRASKPGDWRFTYGYSMTEVDAVLAAFSHDNIGIATNYRLHALTVDYVPMPKTMISAIWYHYRPNDPLHAGSNDPHDWLNRFRLAFLVNF